MSGKRFKKPFLSGKNAFQDGYFWPQGVDWLWQQVWNFSFVPSPKVVWYTVIFLLSLNIFLSTTQVTIIRRYYCVPSHGSETHLPSLHCKNYTKTTSLWPCLPFHIYMTLVLEILFRFTVTKHYNPRHILNSECFIFRSQDRKHFQARFNFGQRSKEKLIASVIHAGYKSSAMLLLSQRRLYWTGPCGSHWNHQKNIW